LIAVVGLGGVFPGAPDVSRFRERLRTGAVEIGEVPEDRWAKERYRGPGADQLTCDRGAYLRELPPWRMEGVPVPPQAEKELHRMERALLAACREAWQDAGATQGWRPDRERTAVVLGFMDYGASTQRSPTLAFRLPGLLDALRKAPRLRAHPRRDEILSGAEAIFRASLRSPGGEEDRVVRVYSSVAAARIASLLDLRGPHASVDAACASSFAALDVAIQGLHDGRFDTVVTGAASPQITPLLLVGLSRLGLLTTGEVRPLDAAAAGTLLGEGAGILVLRRLGDARREGQRVRAVLRGLGGTTAVDGRAAFASSPEGQERALRQAYARAGYGPDGVQYVEAHANGIPQGDQVEWEVLQRVFATAEVGARRVAVGSVKERIGYLLAASGVAGLIRTLVALEDGELPSMVVSGKETPSPSGSGGPLYVNTEAGKRWSPAAEGLPRRASVSAFGFGGCSYHVTLESFHAAYHREEPARARAKAPGLRERPVVALGLGTLLPHSPDLDGFWSTLLTGRDVSTEVNGWRVRSDEDEAEDEAENGAEDGAENGTEGEAAILRAARILEAAPSGIPRLPPKVAARMERCHLWVLDAVRQAMAQAGWAGRTLPWRSAVLLAAVPHGPLYEGLELRVAYPEFDAAVAESLERAGVSPAEAALLRSEVEQSFKRELPPLDEDALLGCMRNIAAARVAREIGAAGPSFVVDAGCASSCAALELAARGLVSGEYELVVVAGMWGGLTAEYLLDTAAFTRGPVDGALPFHGDASGVMPGEGAVALVLEREEDARRHGRKPLLRFRGFGSSGNGRQASIHGLSGPAMVRAIQGALHEAEVSPSSVGLIEAHGACSRLGDEMEAKALLRGYATQDRSSALRVSCLKSVFGQLMSANGLAGVASVTLSLRRGFIPPLPNHQPDARGVLEMAGLAAARMARPWTPRESNVPRRAAVSSYSIGGLNYHLVVEAPGEDG